MQKNPLLRKGLAIGIILLFVATGIIPAIAQDTEKTLPTSRGNWLYVGGSGPGNYTKIQDAIDNASDGDTVFVYSGNYQKGMIRVNKTINLRGEDKNTTVIDGCRQNYVFKLYDVDFAELFIEIKGFTIQNAMWAGIGIFSYNNTISGNIIQNNEAGIALSWAGNNLIYGNVIRKNSFGIRTSSSYVLNNKIERNIIENNSYGLNIKEWADHTIVQYNNIINNSDYGIVVNSCHNTVVEKNNIFGNHQNAYFIIYFNSLKDWSEDKITWKENYWGKTPLRHMAIHGLMEIYIIFGQPPPPHDPIWCDIKWLNFDWRPAQEPYDIPDMS